MVRMFFVHEQIYLILGCGNRPKVFDDKIWMFWHFGTIAHFQTLGTAQKIRRRSKYSDVNLN